MSNTTDATVSVKDDAAWRRWRDLWPIRADTVYLNHGSFGPPPKVVGERQLAWQRRLAVQPMDFFVREYEPAWIAARQRVESDYLCYQDEDGMYADFHANRHIFISNLSKAGIGPKIAQTLARHSNINLTMNTYTHLEMDDRAMAINGLPAPPMLEPSESAESKPPEKFVHMFAKLPASDGIDCHLESQEERIDVEEDADAETKKPLPEQGFVTPCHILATGDTSSGGGTRTPDRRIMIPLL